MKTFPKKCSVTIVVPTYNRSRLLSYTLHSILKQNFDCRELEVIVVDDGSSDDSAETVQQYANRLNIQYHYQEDKGYRVASARNTGIANASGEVILFVDSGVLLGSGAVKAHWEHHQRMPYPVALIGYVYGFDQTNEHALELMELIDCGNPDNTIRVLAAAGKYCDIREVLYRRHSDQIDLLPAPWVLFWTCNVSARRSSILAAGCFDENFDLHWGVEDQDLGLRLQQCGVNIQLCREAASIHYPHFKDTTNNQAHASRNREYFHSKHQLLQTELYLVTDDFDLNDKLLMGTNLFASKQESKLEEKESN